VLFDWDERFNKELSFNYVNC